MYGRGTRWPVCRTARCSWVPKGLRRRSNCADQFGESRRIEAAGRWGESSSEYETIGVSYWLLGRDDEAVAEWRGAKDAKYQDAAGGVDGAACSLFYASVRLSDGELRSEFERYCKRLCRRREAANWPGPLGEFVLGRLTEADLRSKITPRPISRKVYLPSGLLYWSDAVDRRGLEWLLAMYERVS